MNLQPSTLNPKLIYDGSDGEATKLLYDELGRLGELGHIALNLFRASKASQRAKVYRRKFKGMAYEKKNWSLYNLCRVLAENTARLTSGWKEDPAQEYHKWVLYVDLPTGQVSFHSAAPLTAHRYAGEWDGQHVSAKRIIAFVDHVLNGTAPELVLQPCSKCGAPIPIGVQSNLCPPCAIEPATPRELHNLTQANLFG